MTLEEKYNNLYKSKMSDRIYNAFKDVKLGDGIGYGEANCKDDYFTPDDPYYIEQKSLDEREDWRNVVKMIETNDGEYISYVHCFMDAKGLRFYLPVMLTLRQMDDSLWLWFYPLFEEKDLNRYKEKVELISILTSEQKQCLLDCFREDFNLRIQQNFECNTTICCDVHNKIRNPNYTMDQAREYAYAAYEEIYDTANKLEMYFKDLDQVKKKE